MANRYCSLYRTSLFPDMEAVLHRAIAKGCMAAGKEPLLFFRADDIGIPSNSFGRLIDCFRRHRFPLCLATVPAWTTKKRLAEINLITGGDSSQWCWHQHGRLHRNFEQTGKKQEFGPSRTREQIFTQLVKGKTRLEELLGNNFTPVFTPPWNRCSGDTLQALVDLDFKAVSRFRHASPTAPGNLPEFPANVDLHTRKELASPLAFDNLLLEIEQGLSSGLCGIMIHHQRMNRAAFDLLDLLLGLMRVAKVKAVHFKTLLE